jgi:hypothetical protein
MIKKLKKVKSDGNNDQCNKDDFEVGNDAVVTQVSEEVYDSTCGGVTERVHVIKKSPYFSYVKERDGNTIIYKVNEDRTLKLNISDASYDPVFFHMSNGHMISTKPIDSDILRACKKYGITPIPILERFGELLPPEYVPGCNFDTRDESINYQIGRKCPICGDGYDNLTRGDLKNGKHLICDKCQNYIKEMNRTEVYSKLRSNTCKCCGLTYNSLIVEEFCSLNCQGSYTLKTQINLIDDKPVVIPIDITVDKSINNNNLIVKDKPRFKMSDAIKRVCPSCGITFESSRRHLKRNEKIFHSKSCANKHKGDSKVKCECKTCGVSYKSIVKEDFCSEDCKDSFT